MRPVSSVTRSSVSSGSARSVSKWVTAWCGSSVSVEIRVRTRRSRPSGASIVPRRAGGRPSTSARYSRVISRARSAACSAAWVGLVARQQQQAGRVAVEAVHDARALGVRPAGDAARERLHERALRVPAAGMHDDARPACRSRTGARPRRRSGTARARRRARGAASGSAYVDRLAAAQHVALGLGHAVDAHQPGVDQPLRLACACRRPRPGRRRAARPPPPRGTCSSVTSTRSST